LHQLARIGLSSALVFLTFAPPAVSPAPLATVSVLYAGSLVTPMEGPVASALRARGILFQGQPGGSKELANLIRAGVRAPDAFIAVGSSPVAELGSRVASATPFARTSLGLAWSPKTRFGTLLARLAAGKVSLVSVLETPGLRIGRTDPLLDPKGVYTVRAVKAFAGAAAERRILGPDENQSQIFPEEDLLSRVETGEVDVGFFYRTEAVARGYRFVALPPSAASRATYVLAAMSAAPHPAAARTFAAFILHGGGRAILERAGLTYF
jgi:molybdate/tungstate transport system substrate-binding protein